MSMLEWLGTLGTQLGLIRVVEVKDEKHPEKITTRSVTLADLTAELRGDEVRNLAQMPAEMSVAFETVFEAAGIKAPAHGWTIERLKSLLGTEQYKAMDRAAAQQAVLGLLATEKAPVDDLVKDAVARDQSIDAYEGFVRTKLNARGEARQRRTGEIEAQIRQLQEEMARLKEETKLDEQRFGEWKQKKVAYEKELAAAVSYLLEKPIITIDEGQG